MGGEKEKPSSEKIFDCCLEWKLDISEICVGEFPPCIEPIEDGEPLSQSSSVAGRSDSGVDDPTLQLAAQTQCPETTPCRYPDNKCGRQVGLGNGGRVVACPRRLIQV